MIVSPKILHRLTALLTLSLFLGAVYILHHELRLHRLQDIYANLSAVTWFAIALAVLLTALSYFVLTGYDVLALRHTGHRLSYRKAAFASFVGFAFSHNLGGSLLAGGSIRYRIYSTAGLSAGDIATITISCAMTFTLGVMAFAGVALIFEPSLSQSFPGSAPWMLRTAGATLLILVSSYVIFATRYSAPLSLWGITVPLFSGRTVLLQIGLAVTDMALAAGVMYMFMPAPHAIALLEFIGVFVLASVAGIVSHVPGGLGVFETAILLMLPSLPADTVVAAALGYRIVYFLAPLSFAALLRGYHEYSTGFPHIRRQTDRLAPFAGSPERSAPADQASREPRRPENCRDSDGGKAL